MDARPWRTHYNGLVVFTGVSIGEWCWCCVEIVACASYGPTLLWSGCLDRVVFGEYVVSFYCDYYFVAIIGHVPFMGLLHVLFCGGVDVLIDVDMEHYYRWRFNVLVFFCYLIRPSVGTIGLY